MNENNGKMAICFVTVHNTCVVCETVFVIQEKFHLNELYWRIVFSSRCLTH